MSAEYTQSCLISPLVRLHSEAQSIALAFTSSITRALASLKAGASSFSVSFVQCVLYKLKLDSRTLHVLTEPELEGAYIKYNNNNGCVRKAQFDIPAETLVAIQEDREDEDEDEGGKEDAYNPSETPQCFSHYSCVHSKFEKLVCDLQGVWNKTDGFTLTDPVIHTVVGGVKHVNGATDKGAAGIVKFFESHQCGSMCHLLELPSPEEMTQELKRRTTAQQRQASKERQTFERAARKSELEKLENLKLREALERAARETELENLRSIKVEQQRPEQLVRIAAHRAAETKQASKERLNCTEQHNVWEARTRAAEEARRRQVQVQEQHAWEARTRAAERQEQEKYAWAARTRAAEEARRRQVQVQEQHAWKAYKRAAAEARRGQLEAQERKKQGACALQ